VSVLLPLLVAVAVFSGATAYQSMRRRRWLEERFGTRRERRSVSENARLVRARVGRPLERTEARLAGTRLWQLTERLLEQAGLRLRTAELFYIVGAGDVLLFLFVLAAGESFFVALLLAVAAAVGVRVWLSLKAARRVRAFEDQLPELLGSIAGALRAGHSFQQSLQAVVEDAPQPTAGEFARVLAEARLGRSFEEALGDLSRRVGSRELEFALDAVVIQRQVGGSLSGILDIVADAIRQRQQFKLKVRALTSMGRTSARLLLGLPIAVALLLSVLNSSYMHPLFATSAGHSLLLLAAVLLCLGAFALHRTVDVKE